MDAVLYVSQLLPNRRLPHVSGAPQEDGSLGSLNLNTLQVELPSQARRRREALFDLRSALLPRSDDVASAEWRCSWHNFCKRRTRRMNGRTAKLHNRFASLMELRGDRRALKKSWYSLSPQQRRARRRRLSNDADNIASMIYLKDRIAESRGVRRHPMPDGRRALWFSAAFPVDGDPQLEALAAEHPIMVVQDGEKFTAIAGGSDKGPRTLTAREAPIPLTKEAFNRVWKIAVDDQLPEGDFNTLKDSTKLTPTGRVSTVAPSVQTISPTDSAPTVL